MTSYTDTEEFLNIIFPDWRTLAFFAHTPGGVWRETRRLEDLDDTSDCYVSIGAFDPACTHRRDGALEVAFLAVDDVGGNPFSSRVSEAEVEKALGPPTRATQTSPGNQQWFYALSAPVAVGDWGAFARGVEKKIGAKLDPGYTDPVHVFRVPMGVNTKPEYGGFAVHEVAARNNPGVVLDITTIERVGPSGSSSGGGADVKLSRVQLEALMALLPNDLDRDGWIDAGHGLKALSENDDEGFEVFDAWSQLHDSYDAGKTRTAWDSFGASGLRTKGGMLRARIEGLNPERFKKWEAATVFDDDPDPPEVMPGGPKSGITATPFKWMDLSKTSPRDWLYGDILLRKFISMTVAPGGTGKSTLIAVETLAQVCGKALLGDEPAGELRVWLWNLEDTYEETQKKILAAAKHYGIAETEIGDRLFVDSGRDQRLVIAEMVGTTPRIVRPVVGALVEQIRLRGIDVVVIDPFVSCHGVPENDNGAMDMVVKEWGRVAEEGNCAVHLVDHTSKAGSKEVVTDSSRGAKAKTDAARVVRVVNRMTDNDGRLYGVLDTWRYFNTFNDKANMAPPKSRRDWFKMESIWAGNGGGAAQAFSAGAAASPSQGDSIGVAVHWDPPNARVMATGDDYTKVVKAMGDKRWRNDVRAKDWIGKAVALGCGLLPQSTANTLSTKEIIKRWISEGLFKVVRQEDANRIMREYIELAKVY